MGWLRLAPLNPVSAPVLTDWDYSAVLKEVKRVLKGLVIKPYWADLILEGTKTWEIRGSATKHRGPVYIIKSGTGEIYGAARLVDCIPLHGGNGYELIASNRDKHHVPLGGVPYRKPWAWVLEEVIRFKEPISYTHPQGAVIWVNIHIPYGTLIQNHSGFNSCLTESAQ